MLDSHQKSSLQKHVNIAWLDYENLVRIPWVTEGPMGIHTDECITVHFILDQLLFLSLHFDP